MDNVLSSPLFLTGYLRGVDVLEQASVTVKPGEARSFEWKGYGFRIHIPKGALPTDISECTIHITASLSGQFQLPEGCELVSGVYWLSCPVQFAKPVTLDIQHCVAIEKPQQRRFLSFVRSKCSQKQLPYKFRLVEGGTFAPGNTYGSISVTEFSCFGIGLLNMSSLLFSQPRTQPDTLPEAQPEAQPEKKPEAQPEKKPEAQPEKKPETQPEKTQPEKKPETQPEKKPETQPEKKPETQPEKKPETQPEAQPEKKPETQPETPEMQPVVKPEINYIARVFRTSDGRKQWLIYVVVTKDIQLNMVVSL